MTRGATILGEQTNIIAGVVHPTDNTAFFAQTGSSSEYNSGAALVSFAVDTATPAVQPIANEWFTSAAIDSTGSALFLGTVATPATVMRLDSAALDGTPVVTQFDSADGETTFVIQSGEYIYMGVNSHPAQIIRSPADPSSDLPRDTITLAMDEVFPKSAVIDEEAGMLFVGLMYTSPARVLMISLDPFERFCGHSLTSLEGIQTMALDTVYSTLYMGMAHSVPAEIVRVRLDELYGPKTLAKTAIILRDLIPDPHMITWDVGDSWDHMENVVGGYVHDGEGDMYDTGNFISTSAPGCEAIDYHDDFVPTASACFGTALVALPGWSRGDNGSLVLLARCPISCANHPALWLRGRGRRRRRGIT